MNLQGLIPDYYDDFVKDFPGAARELEFIFLKRELKNLQDTTCRNHWEEERLEDLLEWRSATRRVGGWR